MPRLRRLSASALSHACLSRWILTRPTPDQTRDKANMVAELVTVLKGEVFIVHMFRTLTSAVASIRSLVTSPLHSGYVIEYTRTYTN